MTQTASGISLNTICDSLATAQSPQEKKEEGLTVIEIQVTEKILARSSKFMSKKQFFRAHKSGHCNQSLRSKPQIQDSRKKTSKIEKD